MHPALSIVFFTTASGAGFALLALVGIGVPLGLLPGNAAFGFAALAIAVLLAASGLMSSVFHLGRPERAWRAFSQWKTSWLSREGVLSVLSFIPAAVFGLGWLVSGRTEGIVGLCGILAAALAVGTIYCTGMIYRSLKPIHQWHNRWVVPSYFLLGLMGGLLLLDAIVRFWAADPLGIPLLTLIVIALAWWTKEQYWIFVDTVSAPSSVESATGLGRGGKVRLLERPHTEENYLLKEMGFEIARRHRLRLRFVARIAGFAVPMAATALALLGGDASAVLAAVIAVLAAALGLIVERWLFFAEAKHTVTLYYGAQSV
jgi:DMSO reductase anchor subunit